MGEVAFKLTHLKELLEEPDEEHSWVIDELMISGGLSILAGKPKAGKTTMARGLALAVSRGEEFLNRETVQGSVIYLALEEKRAEVKKHFSDLGAIGDEDIFIHAASFPENGLRLLENEVQRIRPILVIIDPLFRLINVRDGNDYNQVTKALEPVLELARKNDTHVLLVHHQRKGSGASSGDEILGSQAIFGAVDCALLLAQRDDRRYLSTRQRYGSDLEETAIVFDADKRSISLGEVKSSENFGSLKEKVKSLFTEQFLYLTTDEIRKEVGGRKQSVVQVVSQLQEEGFLSVSGTGGRGDPKKFYKNLNFKPAYSL